MINTKWINSAHNYEAYNSFETVYSDHSMITATFKLKFRENKNMNINTKPYNFRTFFVDLCLNKAGSIH